MWASNNYDSLSSLNKFNSDADTERLESRPLSPESQSSSFSFFGSGNLTPIGVLEAKGGL